MDAKLIEKLDRQRYWAVLLQAIALLDIVVETTFWYVRYWSYDNQFFNISGIVGLPLFVGAGVWYLVIAGRILRNRKLRDALHNEMYLTYKHRSQRIALWVVMYTLLIFFVFEDIGMLPTRLICEVVFFLGLAVIKVSWLIYNRR